MAVFDESKVINVLHIDRAVIGKKYWFADSLLTLKERIENNKELHIGILEKISLGFHPFFSTDNSHWEFIYPYEEQKQRMTNIQLMEWLGKGKGLILSQDKIWGVSNSFLCCKDELNNEVDEDTLIRTWDSEEWIEPTVDIYERDCKRI